MSIRERIDYSVGLLVVSLALFVIPLFDMWEDVFVGGKPPWSTLLENSIFLGLTLLLIGASVWLLRSDWEDDSVQLVAGWSLAGTTSVALIYAWILGIQMVFQSDLKPVIIAADGVVIGGLVMFVAGVYNARSRRESAALAAERDRFSALFDNTSDAIATVAFDGETPVYDDINEPFERMFGYEAVDLVGRPVGSPFEEQNESIEATPESESVTSVRTVINDPETTAEIRRQTDAGKADFLLEYVPVGNDSDNGVAGFLVFTDITAQKERERQFGALSEGSQGLLDARKSDDIVEVLGDIAWSLFGGELAGIWRYDGESEALEPAAAVTADSAETAAAPTLPAVEDRNEYPSDAAVTTAFSAERLASAVSDRPFTVQETVVRRVADHYWLVIGRDGGFSPTDRHLADVLAANARAGFERLDRERRLQRRNDQLEFVNSLLRHDIQNSMTIIRARAQVLSETLSGRDATYAETIVEQSDDVIDLVDRFRALLDALGDSDDADLEVVLLSSVVEDRVETLETTHPETDVHVNVPPDTGVLADEMIENVIGNVLGNAVEHNDTAEPTVEVAATKHDRTIVLEIADDGPGIPADKRDTVFRRGDRGLKESDIGSGFGLFFVDTMMDRYGGDVRVEGNNPRGAVFVLTFQRPDPGKG